MLQENNPFYKIGSTGNYMFKVNNRSNWTKCEICSELTAKTPERRHWRRSDFFIVNFGVVLVSLLLTLNIFHTLM